MNDVEQGLWTRLRGLTPARIGLGRAGCAQPTRAMLQFQADQARARDAVRAVLATDRIVEDLAPWPCVCVQSRARDRGEYLRRPDLGRRLADDSAQRLQVESGGPWDLVFVLADGLSAKAASDQGPEFIRSCLGEMADLKIAPVVVAEQARVALGDEVAKRLGADAVVILLGERPGLTVAESLGLYFTWHPTIGGPDSLRNCISNIHPGGLSVSAAVHKATWVVRQARKLRLSGVALKEDAGVRLQGPKTRPMLAMPDLDRPAT